MSSNDLRLQVAKRWYAEQRGRVNGNTRAWENLTYDQKLNILDVVHELLDVMEEVWKWSEA